MTLGGAVAQLGERQNRTLEVVGSTPICSTRKIRFQMGESFFLPLDGFKSQVSNLIGRARRGGSGAL